MNIQHTVERTISRNCYISTFFIEDKNLLENKKQKKGHDSGGGIFKEDLE